MSIPFTPPPPLAVIDGGTATSIGVYDTSSRYSSASSSSIIIVIIIIASAIIVSASIYLLLRYLSRRFHLSFSAEDGVVLRHDANSNQQQQCHVAFGDLLDWLPVFTFRSVVPNIAGGDCAVCLSKFEPNDQLRLLPLCCHAFHIACIDAWIVSNQTCPLCRSIVLPAGSDALDKVLSAENRGKINNSFREGIGNGNGGSFRIEIGNISRRSAAAADTEEVDTSRRSYSVGSFEYIVDDSGYEVSVGCTTHSRRFSDFNSNDKESSVGIPIPPEPSGEVLTAEVSGGRNRLRECVDRLSSVSSYSRAMSFRSSSMFFSGSSRRSEGVVSPEDLEAYRAGEEISELFRWLSGD